MKLILQLAYDLSLQATIAWTKIAHQIFTALQKIAIGLMKQTFEVKGKCQ